MDSSNVEMVDTHYINLAIFTLMCSKGNSSNDLRTFVSKTEISRHIEELYSLVDLY